MPKEQNPPAAPTPVNSRAAAARRVARWIQRGDFPDRIIGDDVADRAFVTEVLYGVAKRRRTLEWVVRRLSTGRPDKRALPFLLVGLYQLLYMDSVAAYAAVNETVEAAKADLARTGASFVNAILRRADREKDALRTEIEKQSIGIRESHPDELVTRWIRSWGEKKTLGLCRWNNTRPEVVIHPSAGATGLSIPGATPHPFAPDSCLVLPHGSRVAELPGYGEGAFSVQDPATFKAVGLLDPQPGERILDACAAPGGKTILIAERMHKTGHIVAMDVHEDRLALLRDSLKRMHLESMVTVAKGNASSGKDVKTLADGQPFDRILLDVPCSNTGVLRRRPDARWRFTTARLKELGRIQTTILENASRFLKPGGLLVYSTCSLEPEENADRVQHWLVDHPEFRLTQTVEICPPDSQTDGAFAAALMKAKETNTSLWSGDTKT